MRYCVGGLTTGTGTWVETATAEVCADCDTVAVLGQVMFRLTNDNGPVEALCRRCLARGIRAGLVTIKNFVPPPEGGTP